MAKHSDEFREGVRRRGLAKGFTEERIQEILDAASKGEFKVKPTKDFQISFSLGLLNGVFEELRNMSWQIATLDASDPDFVIGDQPFLRIVPDGKNFGLRNPAINVILPLSKRVAAMGNWNRTMCYTTFVKGKATEINRHTMTYAQRFVFSSQHSDQFLEEAKRLHLTGPKLHHRRVKYGEGLVFIPEYR